MTSCCKTCMWKGMCDVKVKYKCEYYDDNVLSVSTYEEGLEIYKDEWKDYISPYRDGDAYCY